MPHHVAPQERQKRLTHDRDHENPRKKQSISSSEDLEIVLLIDRKELNHSSSRALLTTALKRANIAYEHERNLPVADYLWIVQQKGTEYVLPYLLERKTAADLARSVKEPAKRYAPLTRVELQMIKMQSSEIPNKIYLIEGSNLSEIATEYIQKLRRNHNDFVVHETEHLQGTIKFLIQQHGIVSEYVRQNPPTAASLTYYDLEERIDDELNDPTFKWKLQLLNVKGIGKLEAAAIVDKYSTQNELKQAYRRDGQQKLKETLVKLKLKEGHVLGLAAAERLISLASTS